MEQQRKFPIGLIAILIVAAFVGLGLAVLVLSSNSAAQQNGLPVLAPSNRSLLREGAPAPAFTLNTFDDRSVTLESTRGKATLINFWASWCPPCLEETPALIEAYNELKHANQDIEFIGVGTNDDRDRLKQFAETNDVPYIMVEDPDGKVSDAYGIRGMPTTIFLDSSGIVRKIWNGPIRKEQVIQLMQGLN